MSIDPSKEKEEQDSWSREEIRKFLPGEFFFALPAAASTGIDATDGERKKKEKVGRYSLTSWEVHHRESVSREKVWSYNCEICCIGIYNCSYNFSYKFDVRKFKNLYLSFKEIF